MVLDVGGCTSSQEIRDRAMELADGRSGSARLTVSGELEPNVDLRQDDLCSWLLTTFDAVQVRADGLRTGYEIETISEEQTVRGAFVRDVHASKLSEDEQRRAIVTGLRALDGRDDLDVL